MSAAELAYRAAEIMSQRGHCKGILEDEEGKVCYVGALACADGWKDNHVRNLVIHATEDILRERGYCGDPVDYNNEPYTTGEDIILLLKETGKRLEGK